MSRVRSLSLGAKLNLSLLAFLLLLGAATSAIIIYGFNRTQDSAQERSDAALEDGGRLALYAVAGGAAEQGGLLFEAVAEVGRRASLYAETRTQDVSPEQAAPVAFATSAAGRLYNPDPDRVADVVVMNGASLDDSRVQDDLAFSASLDTIFPVLLQGFAGEIGGRNLDPTAIVFISSNGVMRYYPPIGIHDKLANGVEYSARMTELGPERNPERRTIWTAPYEDGAGQGLIVTARTPVYDGEAFRGTMEVDVSMTNVLAQISQIKPTPRGFAFYVDSAGTLLESDAYDLLVGEAETNPGLAAILEGMRSTAGGDFRTTDAKAQLGGEDYYIAYSTVPVLGGSLAVAAPVSDITAAAAGIGSGIEDEGTRTLQVMVAAMAVLFAVGLLGAGLLNRSAVIKPVNSLVAAARAVGAGDLDARVAVTVAGDELTELGFAFNSMVDQLRESERELEERVEQRTRELQAIVDTSNALSSTLELGPLLQEILDHLQQLVDCDGAAVLLVEGDTLVQLAVRRPSSEGMVDSAPFISPVQSYSTIWKTIEKGDPVMIDDVRGDSPMAEAYRAQVRADLDVTPVAYVRSWAAVPLVARERVTGMLAIAHREAGSFDQRDVELATAVASQAAIAIENVRLYEEAVQRTTELNTLLVADSELHRSLSLDIVLEALVDVMVDSLKADKCIVSLRAPDSEHLVIHAHRNMSQASIDRFNQMYAERKRESGPIVARDIVTHEDISSTEPAVRAVLEAEGVRSTLDAPIITPDGVAGGFDLGYTSPHTFTSYELRLAQAIAERAGVAIRNAQLVDVAAQRARETEALLRADAELFSSLSLDRVLKSLVDVAVDVLGADKSVVLLHEGDIDQIRASRNYNPSNVATSNHDLAGMPHEEPPPAGQVPQVYVHLSDAPEFVRAGLAKEGVVSHVSVPVRDRESMLGVFGVSFVAEHRFTDNEVRLYQALADRAAVAIQNAALYERAQRAGSLEERQRLARELHDSVSQALYGIALGTRTARLRLGDDPHNAAEPIDYVASLAQAGLAEMRALIFELRPESLEQEGLVAAIEKQAASTRARYGLDVRLDLMEEPDCTIETKEAVYRIAQEALHNVVKHANAQQVNVTLEQADDGVTLTIRDDGKGFDASAAFPGHVGLQSMSERAAKLGGTLEVVSSGDQGTLIIARLPR